MWVQKRERAIICGVRESCYMGPKADSIANKPRLEECLTLGSNCGSIRRVGRPFQSSRYVAPRSMVDTHVGCALDPQ